MNNYPALLVSHQTHKRAAEQLNASEYSFCLQISKVKEANRLNFYVFMKYAVF